MELITGFEKSTNAIWNIIKSKRNKFWEVNLEMLEIDSIILFSSWNWEFYLLNIFNISRHSLQYIAILKSCYSNPPKSIYWISPACCLRNPERERKLYSIFSFWKTHESAYEYLLELFLKLIFVKTAIKYFD